MLLENLIRNVPGKDVQCDELWAYVQMKEKTKTHKALTTESSVMPIVLLLSNAQQSLCLVGI